jgi:gamma-butyrobetaine dioxygenase
MPPRLDFVTRIAGSTPARLARRFPHRLQVARTASGQAGEFKIRRLRSNTPSPDIPWERSKAARRNNEPAEETIEGDGAAATDTGPIRVTRDEQGRFVTVEIPALDTPPVRFSALHLRDACPCLACVSPSSGQKSFSTADIPLDISIKDCEVDEAGSLRVRYGNDIPIAEGGEEHVSVFSVDDLPFWQFRKAGKVVRKLWDAETLKSNLRKVDYEQWLAGGDDFWRGLADLKKYGLIFVTNVPQSETAVEEIATRIGNLQDTLYGRTWDVVSKPDAENVAYTNSYLGLHQDLLYVTTPPRIQLLHCLENSCSGGESLFSDGVRAGLEITFFWPSLAEALKKRVIGYHYEKNGHWYRQYRPVLDELDRTKASTGTESHNSHRRRALQRVCWSPPFQQPFRTWSAHGSTQRKELSLWHMAITFFKRLIEHPSSVFEHRLQPGECVVFDNMRTLHGRKAFDTGTGKRWLKGAYVDDQVFASKVRHIPEHIVADYPARFGLSGELEAKNEIRAMVDRREEQPMPELPDLLARWKGTWDGKTPSR